VACPDGQTFNAVAKTCTDASDVQVTQEIVLKAGKNYISFYVFTPGLNVVDIFNQNKQEWLSAVLYMKGVGGDQNFATSPPNTQFPSRTRTHANSNTYILVMTANPSIPNPVLRLTGRIVTRIDSVQLQVSDQNWLAAISAATTSNQGVLPIRAACPAGVPAGDCFPFTYLRMDSVKFFPRDITKSVVASIESNGLWDQRGNIERGDVVLMTINPHTSRPQDTKPMYTQIDATSTMQALTYATTSTRSSLVGSYLANALQPQTSRRLLSIASQTTPQYCGTQANCQCRLAGITLKWPLDDCNSCVQAGDPAVCNGMGTAMEDSAFTFVVRASPPAGVNIVVNPQGVSNAIAVAKVKRSFVAGTGGVQYEHINIRSARPAFCGGCAVPASGAVAARNNWGHTFCGACLEANKLFLFSLPMQLLPTEVKNAGDTTALNVNFEFDIAGVLYVTDHHERLRKVVESGVTLTKINTHLQRTLQLVPKRFEIRCPRDYSLLHATSHLACPFEGTMPASVVIDSATVSSLPANSANYVTEGQFRTRSTFIAGVRTDAESERLYYTIKSTGTQILYVTITKANFETCTRAGVWRTSGTRTCDPAAPAENRLPANFCLTAVMYATKPFAQTDALHITHFGNNSAVLNTTTYDRNSALSAPRTFVLSGDQQRLEIELLLDGNECADSKTEITMTMLPTPPNTARTQPSCQHGLRRCRMY